MVMRIKKNDTILVLSGKDKGKKGSVVGSFPKKDTIIVKDIAVATRHAKARRQDETAGIKKRESEIAASRVMPFCTSCQMPCRVSSSVLENGKRMRCCKRCREIF